MRNKLGRNDPCHCGSGKKYKRCHMAQDEQERLAAHAPVHVPAPAPTPEPPVLLDIPGPPKNIKQAISLLRELPLKATGKNRAAFEEIAASTQPLLTYLEQQEQIDAAANTLEAHRGEFVTLVDNVDAFIKRSQTLFAEETFAPLRFTEDDIQRASDHLGSLGDLFSDQGIETIRKAILFLTDEDRRTRIALNLLALLPRYVAEGRHLDGHIIQHSAYLTMEEPTESNPFLFAMFSFGYDAWREKKRARDAEMLKGIGLDVERLPSMSMEELESCLETFQADPAKRAQIEAMMEAHPDQRDEAVENLRRMERDSINLLEGENARALLLSPEEIQPWLPAINECWEHEVNQHPELMSDSTPLDDSVRDEFIDAIWPQIKEMAKSIFTPERIQQLVSQLKKYRNEQFNAGDKSVAGWSFAAISSLEGEDDPAQNYFLNAVCFASLRQCIGEIASDPDSVEEAEAPPSQPAT